MYEGAFMLFTTAFAAGGLVLTAFWSSASGDVACYDNDMLRAWMVAAP